MSDHFPWALPRSVSVYRVGNRKETRNAVDCRSAICSFGASRHHLLLTADPASQQTNASSERSNTTAPRPPGTKQNSAESRMYSTTESQSSSVGTSTLSARYSSESPSSAALPPRRAHTAARFSRSALAPGACPRTRPIFFPCGSTRDGVWAESQFVTPETLERLN